MSDGSSVSAVAGLPEIERGRWRSARLIAERAELRDGDVVVVSQKVVSKAEGRVRRLSLGRSRARRRASSPPARQGAGAGRADPRREPRGAARRARRADHRDPPRLRLRQRRHRQLEPARARTPSACCPRTPTPPRGGSGPSCETARRGGVGASIVADSFGRAWRLGQAEVAIGCAGIAPLDDWRGRADAGGRSSRRRRSRSPTRPRRRPTWSATRRAASRPRSSAASTATSPRRTGRAPPPCARPPRRGPLPLSSGLIEDARRRAGTARARRSSSARFASLERVERRPRSRTGTSRRQRQELLAVAPGQVGDRAERPLPPEDLVGEGRDVAHVDAGADHPRPLGAGPQRRRHQRADRGEDDRAVELLGRSSRRRTRPTRRRARGRTPGPPRRPRG